MKKIFTIVLCISSICIVLHFTWFPIFVKNIKKIIFRFSVKDKKTVQLKFSDSKKLFLEDRPLFKGEVGAMDRTKTVAQIVQIIKSTAIYSECVNICISGKWGEGKTSVLNHVKGILDNEESYEYIDIDPWFYNDIGSAQKTVLRLLASRISNNFPYADANKSMEKYINLLTGGILKHFTGIRLPKNTETLSDIKITISEYIVNTGKRYILVFDDLDRLNEEDFKLIVKIIMSLKSIKGLVIIMLMDIDKIYKYFDEEQNFLEKIITITVPLPKIEPLKYAKLLDKYLRETILRYEYKEDYDKFEKSYYKYDFLRLLNFNTLRNIKRFIMMFDIFYKQLKGEVNIVDLFAVVYLYLFYQEVYNDMYLNRNKYIGEGKISDIPKKNNYFNDMLELFDKNKKSDLRKILSRISSEFYYEEENKKYSYTDWDDTNDDFLRIVNEISFYKYFIFKPAENDISDVLIKTNLQNWKNNENNDDILDFLNKYYKNINVFFEKLNGIYADTISENLLKKIIALFINIPPMDSSSFDVHFLSSQIKNLLEHIGNKEQFIEDLIKNGKTLDILWNIALYQDRINKDQHLQQMLFKKIDEMPTEEVLDNLSYANFYNYITKTTPNVNKEYYSKKDNFLSVIKTNKKWVMKFVMPRIEKSSSEGYTFNIDIMVRLYGYEFIDTVIDIFKEHTGFTSEESKDYKEFCKKYSEYKSKWKK